jgi:hypothetical protein
MRKEDGRPLPGKAAMTRRLGAEAYRPLLFSTALAIILSGCATTAEQQPIFRSTPPAPPVELIVKVPCVDPAKLKPVPPSQMKGAADWAGAANGLAADAITYRLLAMEQYDLLKSCTTVKKDP